MLILIHWVHFSQNVNNFSCRFSQFLLWENVMLDLENKILSAIGNGSIYQHHLYNKKKTLIFVLITEADTMSRIQHRKEAYMSPPRYRRRTVDMIDYHPHSVPNSARFSNTPRPVSALDRRMVINVLPCFDNLLVFLFVFVLFVICQKDSSAVDVQLLIWKWFPFYFSWCPCSSDFSIGRQKFTLI